MAPKKAKLASAEGIIKHFEKKMTDAEAFNLANDQRLLRFLLDRMTTDTLDKVIKAALEEQRLDRHGARGKHPSLPTAASLPTAPSLPTTASLPTATSLPTTASPTAASLLTTQTSRKRKQLNQSSEATDTPTSSAMDLDNPPAATIFDISETTINSVCKHQDEVEGAKSFFGTGNFIKDWSVANIIRGVILILKSEYAHTTANADTPGKRELFEQDPKLFQQIGNLVLLETKNS
jgi:hypothetical protein